MAVDIEKIAAEQAPLVARDLLAAANRGGTEADFRREAARILEQAGVAAELTIVPRDEFSVARGRVDSVYNRLILEYKRPGIIRSSLEGRANQDVIQQVKDYILDVAKRERREAHRLAGVAIDGFHYIFVRRVGEGWSVPELMPVNVASTELFLRLLFSLAHGVALVPENLVEDFGPRTLRAQRAVRALYTALHTNKQPLVLKLFEQWRLFFSEATDYKEWAEKIESKQEFRTFVKGMGLDPKYSEAPKVFFALHTYYALLIKLVASLAAARFAAGASAPLSGLAGKQGEELRQAFTNLEHGGLFREYGIRNFLEGDFFGWYLAAWNQDIEDGIRHLLQRLAEYDPGTLELAPENARDLLKKLYHYLLPREIRHDLGEYYTPDWLAERLIIQTLGKSDLGDASKRVLDPACGSGTFLVILIKHIKERVAERKQNATAALQAILRNVIGFDLNPLAVIAARTNYLLALGDLLKARTSDIDIPVYQADSVLTPSQGSDVFTDGVYPLKTSVGEFRIPAFFAERERMDALANTLDESVEAGLGDVAFLNMLGKRANLKPKDRAEVQKETTALYRQLRDLHEHGLNGVWARIIKNAFAPLFIEPCDYLVGNPPWVNWEHLPDEYRRSTMPLWEHYGLFPKREKALETILGAAKYDISMLMTYVAGDKYLRAGGKLGFVLPQNLFKTSGAGQGFRRFLLPDEVPFGPILVEDMVELDPFEGPANRTAVAVFTKGHRVRYPVPYSHWRKRRSGRGSALGFDTPYEEITKEKITFKAWFAEPVDPKDPTSAWITAAGKTLAILRKINGRSGYVGRKGVYASANGVFWVEIIGTRPDGQVLISNFPDRGKIKVPQVQAAVEPDLVHPLLRGMDVSRWRAERKVSIILTHEKGMRLKALPETEMQSRYPKTWAYLAKHAEILKKTGLFRRFCKPGDPFYSMFDIGDYTFSDWKVVIREIAGSLTCAVVGPTEGRPIIPDHKLVLVATSSSNEAHYLCAVLNSTIARLFASSYCIETQFSSHIFNMLGIPTHSPTDKCHRQLADLSIAAHNAATERHETWKEELARIEGEIDVWTAKLWELSAHDLAEIKRCWEEVS